MFTIASLEVSSGQQAFAQHEHSPASSIPEGANSVRVTFSRRSPQCKPLDLRNQVQSQLCVGGFAFHQLELQPVAVAFGQLSRDAGSHGGGACGGSGGLRDHGYDH
jgi:hypothetical protein